MNPEFQNPKRFGNPNLPAELAGHLAYLRAQTDSSCRYSVSFAALTPDGKPQNIILEQPPEAMYPSPWVNRLSAELALSRMIPAIGGLVVQRLASLTHRLRFGEPGFGAPEHLIAKLPGHIRGTSTARGRLPRDLTPQRIEELAEIALSLRPEDGAIDEEAFATATPKMVRGFQTYMLGALGTNPHITEVSMDITDKTDDGLEIPAAQVIVRGQRYGRGKNCTGSITFKPFGDIPYMDVPAVQIQFGDADKRRQTAEFVYPSNATEFVVDGNPVLLTEAQQENLLLVLEASALANQRH